MKKKIVKILLIVIIVICIIGSVVITLDINRKKSANKRYTEIKESVKKAVEWNLKAQYPSCPISNDFDKNANNGESFYNSSFLINNGYLKKEELLDIDGKSYCDIYVVIRVKYEDPLDHQNNCSTSYKAYIKCNDYEDKGYIDWGNK
ncbi:MAG: hypothetical protein Q4E69_02205 [Bacilli bacterium]|nr:hypothetical protein [Bacilli bacterium]